VLRYILTDNVIGKRFKEIDVETSKRRNVETSKRRNVETSKRRNIETLKHRNVLKKLTSKLTQKLRTVHFGLLFDIEKSS
jgi:hypothetical protein